MEIWKMLFERIESVSAQHPELVGLVKAIVNSELSSDEALEVAFENGCPILQHLCEVSAEELPEVHDLQMAVALYLGEYEGRETLSDLVVELLGKTDDVETHIRLLYAVGQVAWEIDEVERALKALDDVLAIRPQEVNAMQLKAEILAGEDRLEEAMAVLDTMTDFAAPGLWDWDRMVVATLLEDEDRLRHSAERLGIESDAESYAELNQNALLRIDNDEDEDEDNDGEVTEPINVMVARTGPVTVRVVELGPPNAPQHFLDEWTFAAKPLWTPKEDDPVDEDALPILQGLNQIAAGGFQSYIIDGPCPSDKVAKELVDALVALDVVAQRVSDDSYEVTDTQEKCSVPGGLFLIGVPHHRPVAEVAKALMPFREICDNAWLGLAQAIGDTTEIEAQAAVCMRYDLESRAQPADDEAIH